MGFRLKPKEEKFYKLLMENTQLIHQAANCLEEAMHSQKNIIDAVAQVDDLESQADEITSKIFELLNKTFITPMDREDIYAITNTLDDIIDSIQGVIERMQMYNIGEPSEAARELSILICRATKQIEKMFEQISQIKKNKEKLKERCDKIVAMEMECDRLYRQEVGKLFRECNDPVEIIKWKEILLNMEETLDVCEDLADLIKGAIIKYA